MASIVQEDDLIPEESDLEQPGETAAGRLAGIAATPLPETAAPPLWNKKSRAGVRLVTGVALPAIATGGAIGGAGALRGMAGAAAAEGLDALMSPSEERPSLGGAAARVAMQGAIPAVAGKVASKLAPLAEKIPSLIPKSAMESEAASLARNVIHKATLFKAIPTEMKGELDAIVKEATHYSPLIDAKDILQTFAEKRVIFGKAEFDNIVEAVEIAAKDGNGNVALPELHAILRTAQEQAGTRAQKAALKLVKKDILDTMEKHISEVHPLGAAAGTLFRKLNNEIGTKLGIAEDAIHLFQVDPLKAVRNIASNPEATGVIKALDHMTGSQFGPKIAALSQTAISEGQKAGQAAALTAAQHEARKLLKGVLAVGGTMAGAASGAKGGIVGGIGGGMGGLLLSLFATKMPGALPLEGATAKTAMGAAKAAPAATAAVGRGATAALDQLFPAAAAPVDESDLDLDEESP
jgi:hypothetical protein